MKLFLDLTSGHRHSIMEVPDRDRNSLVEVLPLFWTSGGKSPICVGTKRYLNHQFTLTIFSWLDPLKSHFVKGKETKGTPLSKFGCEPERDVKCGREIWTPASQ